MTRPFISAKLRFDVFSRDQFTCQYCGRKAPHVKLHADHIVPVAQGGLTNKGNLRTSCEGCNGGKGARTPDCEQLDPRISDDSFVRDISDWDNFFTVDPTIHMPICE